MKQYNSMEIIDEFYDVMIDVEEAEMKVNNLLIVLNMIQENYDCNDERQVFLAVLDITYNQIQKVQQELISAMKKVDAITIKNKTI